MDFGFDEIPSLAFFQKGIPTKCDVDLKEETQVLKWILQEADLWVEPPVIEQLYLIESTRQEMEWQIETSPSLVLFESDEPHFYHGDLSDSEALLTWIKQFVAEEQLEDESSGEIEATFVDDT